MVKEEDKVEYWNRKWELKKQNLQERVALDGSDGEEEFDRELLRRARNKAVLDIGCGPGEFTLRVAQNAESVTGIDPSETALMLAGRNLAASGLTNVTFRNGKAERLPFSEGSFDLAYSRRGPASENKHNLSEARRILRRGGVFMEITIGERDKQNIVEIFGRGQMRGTKGQVSSIKKNWLEEVGFKDVVSRDYLGTEIFHSLSDLIIRLRTAPIIPSFSTRKDRHLLKTVRARCTTDRGIETPVHRVILIGRK